MRAPSIFGREPAIIVAVIQAAIVLLGSQLFDWTEDQILAVSVIVVVLGDAFVAWVTHDTLLGVAVGLIKALAACAAVFGVHLPADLVPQLIALATTVIALFQRTQTFPVYAPPKAVVGSTPVSNVGTR
jgi:hypothetical protein